MTFTLGLDLGLVMAKGVALGVISCVTVLPAMILVLDKPLQKTKHKSLIPDMTKLCPRRCEGLPHLPHYIRPADPAVLLRL